MQITDVRIRKVSTPGSLKAVVSVTIDDAVAIHDIRIVETEDSRFFAMPTRKTREGTFLDVVHPINSEVRKEFEDAIFAKYEEMLQAEDGASEEA